MTPSVYSAVISWDAVEGADSYQIHYRTSTGSYGDAINTEDPSYTLNGLEPSTSYYYQIRTKKGDNYSAWTDDGAYFTTSAHSHNDTDLQKWISSSALPPSGTYYLGNNVTLVADWAPASDLILCLNGKTVNMGNYSGTIAHNVTIYDDVDAGLITGSHAPQVLHVSANGVLAINGGKIRNTGSGQAVTADPNATLIVSYSPIALSEADDNSALLIAHDGYLANVALTRSFVADMYNTICLPFSLTAAQITAAFGAGTTLLEMSSDALDGEQLLLNFSAATAIQAGKPYLIQPAHAVANPAFTGVTLRDDNTPYVGTNIDFIGVTSPIELTTNDHNTLFLGENNELFWPNTDDELNGMRAYFHIKSGAALVASRARIVMPQAVPTALPQAETATGATKQLQNGQLIIRRDNRRYNAIGARIQ